MPQGEDEIGAEPPENANEALLATMAYDFNRCETRLQTSAVAKLQETSMEIWGLTPYGGNVPTVQAYRESHRPLAAHGPRGILFDSVSPPTPGTGTPFEARWRLGTPGVFVRSGKFAAICIKQILNLQP